MERKVQFYSEGTPVVGILGIPEDYKAGEQRGAVIFCQGFTGVKEMYLPKNAERLRAEGYVTLNFDYRYFGESGGEPRSRLVPMAQVADIRNAITYMQTLPEVNPDRIGLYGTSFGCANVVYTAGIDERAKCIVAVVGPGDCERQFRLGPNFDAFMDKVRRAKAEFVATGKVTYMQTARMMARDPDVVAELEKAQSHFPTWRPEVSFESLADVMEFKPESVADRISPRALLLIHTDKDKLVPLSEAQSVYAKARHPRKLIVLENMVHDDVYRGQGFEQVVQHANAWFKEYMPAR
ncbi:MAG TPA: alpha/beta hydrolase [Methylomirabilota bacterium]|nr:alpha/beta hydrolase [Methylomirabilota bacterium]